MKSKKDQLVDNIMNGSGDPSWDTFDWDALLSDQEGFEMMMSTLVKSHSGKKKIKVSKAEGGKLFGAAQGHVSGTSFDKTFSGLVGDETVRRSAKKIGVSPAHVYNLKTGRSTPSIELIESIALAYKVHPSYFLEYRTFYILSALREYLEKHPETASSWFSKLSKGQL